MNYIRRKVFSSGGGHLLIANRLKVALGALWLLRGIL